MTATPLARASARNFSTWGTVSPQRGRTLQVCLTISMISKAVVLVSTVTGLRAGADGTFTFAHSSMILPADAAAIPAAIAAAIAAAHANAAIIFRFMKILP